MNRLGTGIAGLAIVLLSACGGSGDTKIDATPETSAAPPAAPVDWVASCDAVDELVTEHINDILAPAEEYLAFADGVDALLEGANPDEAGLLVDAANAGRLHAQVDADPDSGASERLDANGAVLDSLDALAAKCLSEGSTALS